MSKSLRVVVARTMPNFSMHVYADGIIAGLRTVRPDWAIIDLAPQQISRHSRSPSVRATKAYERFWHFPRQVAAEAADIFHIIDHSEGHIAYTLAKRGKPVVITCHDLINFRYRDNLKGSVQLPFVSSGLWEFSVNGLHKADRTIAVSQTTANDMSKLLHLAPEHIAVIPNAVDASFKVLPSQQGQAYRHQQGTANDAIVLLNVGSNHPRKNIPVILEALSALQNKRVKAQFWKVGADFTLEEQQFIRDRQLDSHIRYLGQPSNSDLITIYNAADVLVAPSTHEGFGLTILEAMACGTPVITSNLSAMPEVAGDAAVLVNPQDVGSIVTAILRLKHEAHYRQSLVQKGLARAHTFTWANTAQQIAGVYEKVIADRN